MKDSVVGLYIYRNQKKITIHDVDSDMNKLSAYNYFLKLNFLKYPISSMFHEYLCKDDSKAHFVIFKIL